MTMTRTRTQPADVDNQNNIIYFSFHEESFSIQDNRKINHNVKKTGKSIVHSNIGIVKFALKFSQNSTRRI